MAQNHIQEGAVLQYTNGSGSTITSGSAVVVGELVGVPLVDILDGETGSVAVEEVWALPKEEVAIGQGVSVYLTATGTITTTETDNDYAGKAFDAAASGDATANVKLNV